MNNHLTNFFCFIQNQLAGHYLSQDELVSAVASEYLKQLEEWEWNLKVARNQSESQIPSQNMTQISSQLTNLRSQTNKKLEISIVYTGGSQEVSQQAREIKYELKQAYPNLTVHIEQILSCQSLIMITSNEPQQVLWHTFIDGKFAKDKFMSKISLLM